MDKDKIINLAEKFINDAPGNYITQEAALRPRHAGMKIFEAPMLAFGAADDGLYTQFKAEGVIGSHFLSPTQWLPGAKTVISFFLPYTARINAANAADHSWPAEEWLHGRYEGQLLVRQLVEYLVELISGAGFAALAPSFDPRHKFGAGNNMYTSNWSERHIAYACGLGTFGLSKGLITKKGTSGRFGSLVTELDLPKDARDYSGVHDYCTMCGICIGHCPAAAISFENGKKSALCSGFLDKTREKHTPRYGCGKCQVGVPCESGLPK